MDMPKEIFLKDYKKPDYYFDTVRMLLIDKLVSVRMLIFFHIDGAMFAGGLEIYFGRGENIC